MQTQSQRGMQSVPKGGLTPAVPCGIVVCAKLVVTFLSAQYVNDDFDAYVCRGRDTT